MEQRAELIEVRDTIESVLAEVGKVYVGQGDFVRLTLIALVAGGHVLIESVPGLGKTLLVRLLGQILGCQFGRIQFTADLMPSDITGQPVFDTRTQDFRFRQGPVFTQILLADEINRSPAKTHAALLEIMQERCVTVDGVTYPLTPPFLVLATQNPVESEGTYNLPEAQLDRFMFKLVVDYPAPKEEEDILKLHCRKDFLEKPVDQQVSALLDAARIGQIQTLCQDVLVNEKIITYISNIVRKTRDWSPFYLGASPRAGIAILNACRVQAAFAGRSYVIPDDVIDLAVPALRHRVILSPEAEVEGETTDHSLLSMLKTIEVPRL
ncbi:AAA family ATPase [Schlesneria paludicola]|uniref:AAA family ATPase n=1 Tax=Schlesneria paludicola TaxID=360056 RepID=UPI00029A2DA0|nr:MoxR family ATPase [Schlesneria paludicola]